MIEPSSPVRAQCGTSLLEVLITIVILAIGLLGLAGLQARLQSSEMESYQRAQALVLINDMASRIATNRANAADYVTGSASPLGAGMACPAAGAEQQETDASEWCEALQGAGETLSGSYVGAMVGGRGCVEDIGGGQYLVTVAWQGLTPSSAPDPACGQNLYNGATGSACAGDKCRRVITTIVRIGDLT
jgi:type IV pilus assembly protein PilV